jgi:hypothetical protein
MVYDCYESISSDEVDSEYYAWLDEMNRDMRDRTQFEREDD